MHTKTLFTPRYWLSKFNMYLFKKRFPEAPWLTESAVFFLAKWLKSTDFGIEWGSGRSTIWLSSHISHLISIESDKRWFENTKLNLFERNLLNKVDLYYCPIDAQPLNFNPYSNILNKICDSSLDFALVDGLKLRNLCMELVIPKIKPGGLLILDNSERFLPNKIMGHYTVSITNRDNFYDEQWKALAEKLCSWREVITTNGVWDTSFWIKPN